MRYENRYPWAVLLQKGQTKTVSRHQTFSRAHEAAQTLIRARGSSQGVTTVYWPADEKPATPLEKRSRMHRIKVLKGNYVIAVYFNKDRDQGIEQARMTHGDRVTIEVESL